MAPPSVGGSASVGTWTPLWRASLVPRFRVLERPRFPVGPRGDSDRHALRRTHRHQERRLTASLVVDHALDAVATAEAAGLRYVTDDRPGIRRRRAGKGFAYYRPDGALIRERGELRRIRRDRDPTGLDGRVDRPESARPHPRHRPGRPRAQAVPLPPRLARRSRRQQVRPDARRSAPPCPISGLASSATSASADCRVRRSWRPCCDSSTPPSCVSATTSTRA